MLRLVGPDGAEPLEVTLTPAGPVLRLRAGLTVAVEGKLALRADELSLQAQTALDLGSAGSLTLRAGGELRTEARTQAINATGGDVRVTANDDVVMVAERIKLNC